MLVSFVAESADRRQFPRAPFSREVRVGRLTEISTIVARDLSEGGIFLEGCEAAIGERLTIEFVADELPGVRFKAEVEVVRRTDGERGGAGTRFVRFEEGGSALSRLVTFLLTHDP